jgi:hypothetical protein
VSRCRPVAKRALTRNDWFLHSGSLLVHHEHDSRETYGLAAAWGAKRPPSPPAGYALRSHESPLHDRHSTRHGGLTRPDATSRRARYIGAHRSQERKSWISYPELSIAVVARRV